eukprot:CAMPEP_0172712520 /NCGR_PEP_ID=MMETSP1074-20121228/61149_1 /TAXON_ID=2916 /ORGANISM="Ceratium fusus, Strain PA161109" /LENGTH=60 /DNA_ID=CAMNT_0013536461 /DNA_START=76 /DNA_END=255 /DNA_ORIENTATION=+
MIFFTVTIEVAAAGENDEEKKTEVKEGDESKLEEVDEDGLRRICGGKVHGNPLLHGEFLW